MDQDYHHHHITLAMHHEGAGLYLMGRQSRWDFRARPGTYMDLGERTPAFEVVSCSAWDVQCVAYSLANFTAVDAEPSFTTVERQSIKDFNLFAPCLARTEEIIIEPQSVAECLDLIRKMQAPELQAVRKRNEQRREPINQQNFHAQILSLAA